MILFLFLAGCPSETGHLEYKPTSYKGRGREATPLFFYREWWKLLVDGGLVRLRAEVPSLMEDEGTQILVNVGTQLLVDKGTKLLEYRY